MPCHSFSRTDGSVLLASARGGVAAAGLRSLSATCASASPSGYARSNVPSACTAAMVAAQNGHLEVVKFLGALEGGALLREKKDEGSAAAMVESLGLRLLESKRFSKALARAQAAREREAKGEKPPVLGPPTPGTEQAIAGLRDMVPKEVLRDVRNLTSKATHKHLTTIAGATIADAVDGIADTVIGGVGGVVDGVAEVVGDVADAAVGLPTALSTQSDT